MTSAQATSTEDCTASRADEVMAAIPFLRRCDEAPGGREAELRPRVRELGIGLDEAHVRGEGVKLYLQQIAAKGRRGWSAPAPRTARAARSQRDRRCCRRAG